MSDRPSLPLPGILRAPIVWVGLVISLYLTGIFCATVSVGGWIEGLLRWLGLKRVGTVSAVGGVLGFLVLGVAAPLWLGNRLIGWPGLILGPLLALALVAILDRW